LKIWILFFTVCIAFAAQFKESRYIEALGINTISSGLMQVSKDEITLQYVKPHEKTMIFNPKGVKTISQMQGTRSVDYDQNPQLYFIYRLMLAIYLQNDAMLEEYFEITDDQNVRILHPKANTKKLFDKVFIETTQEKMILNITMQSGDRVSIESTH
jgi:hypothetical protein